MAEARLDRPPRRSRWLRTLAVGAVLLTVVGLTAANWESVWAALPGRVGAPAETFPVEAPSAEDQSAIRLAVLGDVGTGDEVEWAIADLVTEFGADDPFDALVLLGDNVYPDGDPELLDKTVFDPFAGVLDGGASLLPVLGNHDVRDGNGPGQVAALGMPGRWYSADLGPARFVGLDSTRVDDADQLEWLENTLADSPTDVIIVAMHHPAYSAGFHGSDGSVQKHWVPLFERYGVDLVLAGHDHDYQRSIPIDGVTYVVSGAGAKLRPTGRADFTAFSASVHHFVDIAIWNDRIELKAISQEGLFDKATISTADSLAVTPG